MVYAATDGERHGALKISPFPRSCTPSEAERAWPTIRMRLDEVASLDHPAIIAVWDCGLNAQQGQIWVAMERVWAAPLPQVAPTLGPRNWEPIARALSSALAHAHAAQVWHGDIKPSNLLVSPNNHPTILDFALTGPQPAPGSPQWMAPECVGGSPASLSADIYALGQCLAEMVMGKPAFSPDGKGPARLLHLQRLKSDCDRIDAGEGAPAALREAIASATAQAPQDRPTAQELATLLAT